MTPVMQSKLWTPDAPLRGNCNAACLASLLDIPLWMVPPFEDMAGDLQSERRNEWLIRLFGYSLERIHGHEAARLPEFYIACGPSPRGDGRIYHAVVYRAGVLAHDPHPSGAGILDVEWTWHLERTDNK